MFIAALRSRARKGCKCCWWRRRTKSSLGPSAAQIFPSPPVLTPLLTAWKLRVARARVAARRRRPARGRGRPPAAAPPVAPARPAARPAAPARPAVAAAVALPGVVRRIRVRVSWRPSRAAEGCGAADVGGGGGPRRECRRRRHVRRRRRRRRGLGGGACGTHTHARRSTRTSCLMGVGTLTSRNGAHQQRGRSHDRARALSAAAPGCRSRAAARAHEHRLLAAGGDGAPTALREDRVVPGPGARFASPLVLARLYSPHGACAPPEPESPPLSEQNEPPCASAWSWSGSWCPGGAPPPAPAGTPPMVVVVAVVVLLLLGPAAGSAASSSAGSAAATVDAADSSTLPAARTGKHAHLRQGSLTTVGTGACALPAAQQL